MTGARWRRGRGSGVGAWANCISGTAGTPSDLPTCSPATAPWRRTLVQDAFARLAGRFVDLRAPDAFEAYLRRMVVNLARMHFRRRRLERLHLLREASLQREESSSPDLADYEAMKQALLTLPERQRAAIVLRFYADLSERQIADVMGCRPGTVKSLVHRGIKGLRIRLGPAARLQEY